MTREEARDTLEKLKALCIEMLKEEGEETALIAIDRDDVEALGIAVAEMKKGRDA